MTLMQYVGLVPRDLGVLRVEDRERADRIPTGSELQNRFESIIVTDADLTSEAELAFQYGDQAAAGAAARDARDSAQHSEE